MVVRTFRLYFKEGGEMSERLFQESVHCERFLCKLCEENFNADEGIDTSDGFTCHGCIQDHNLDEGGRYEITKEKFFNPEETIPEEV